MNLLNANQTLNVHPCDFSDSLVLGHARYPPFNVRKSGSGRPSHYQPEKRSHLFFGPLLTRDSHHTVSGLQRLPCVLDILWALQGIDPSIHVQPLGTVRIFFTSHVFLQGAEGISDGYTLLTTTTEKKRRGMYGRRISETFDLGCQVQRTDKVTVESRFDPPRRHRTVCLYV